jgi:hypothetical protein
MWGGAHAPRRCDGSWQELNGIRFGAPVTGMFLSSSHRQRTSRAPGPNTHPRNRQMSLVSPSTSPLARLRPERAARGRHRHGCGKRRARPTAEERTPRSHSADEHARAVRSAPGRRRCMACRTPELIRRAGSPRTPKRTAWLALRPCGLDRQHAIAIQVCCKSGTPQPGRHFVRQIAPARLFVRRAGVMKQFAPAPQNPGQVAIERL